ncbi:hypothetical protein DFA_08860 [Cavenderia fasciculata]|uniref:PH domain-containing protein n=1 Tax=Cavenderia fasciculata TaxID=261658 RepID=F4Q4R3_CACFS|nr:uncharacterized protein DFA_08860 [Cavenderia fasciculata]EGG17859.1 hypothetical protein DFA_08860 [Cavenderia fasciculata]|eukprot:XP_004356343.1 hypothetical protein DFA_08860 [Cavenderia fasciculata]
MIETIEDIIDFHSTNEKSKLLATTKTLEIILNALGKWKCTNSSIVSVSAATGDDSSAGQTPPILSTDDAASTKSSSESSSTDRLSPSISRTTNNNNSDSTVPIQLANILCEIVKENTDLILPILSQFYETISYLIINNPSPSGTPPSSPPRGPNADPTDVINTAIFTMFGNICFLFPKNQNLLSQSIPHVLDIAKKSTLVQSIVYSTLASEAVNQPNILTPFIKQLINHASYYPNYFSILGGLCQYDKKEFESNIVLLVESFEKVPEARASIMEIIGHMSKNSASVLAIIPYLARLKVALTLESLASHMAIILKCVASRYPHILDSLLLDDVIESINKFPVAKYSLIEVVGMCSASHTNRAYQYLVTMLQKQQRQSISNDSNSIVAILKGLRSIQRTTPDLLTSVEPFQRFVAHPSASDNDQISEFIVTMAQEIIDNIQNYNNRENMISPLPSLANGNNVTTGIDVRVGQCLVELEKVDTTATINDKYLLETYYSIILETLSFIPIPSHCDIIKKEIKLSTPIKQSTTTTTTTTDVIVVEEKTKEDDTVTTQPEEPIKKEEETEKKELVEENKPKEEEEKKKEEEESTTTQQQQQDVVEKIVTITIYTLSFTFGHETIELLVQDENEIQVWKNINRLLSIVNLKPFLKVDQQDQQQQQQQGDSKSIISFVTFKDIQEIHKQLESLLEKTSLSPRCAASPVGASARVNQLAQDPAIPLIRINSVRNNNNGEDDDDDDLVLPTQNGTRLNVGPYEQQQPILLHQGRLFKKSKYLKRDDAYWFELYPTFLIGKKEKTEKEKDKENRDNNKGHPTLGTSSSSSSLASATTTTSTTPLHEEEIKIVIKEIREIKMVEGENKKMGIFKSKPNPHKEQKTFCITTAKRKFLFKAIGSEEKAVWINKIKQLYQQLVYRHHHNNGEFNFNQLDLTIPVNNVTGKEKDPNSPQQQQQHLQPQKSPVLESTNPSIVKSTSAPTSPVSSEPTSPRKKKKLMRRFTQYLPKMKN